MTTVVVVASVAAAVAYLVGRLKGRAEIVRDHERYMDRLKELFPLEFHALAARAAAHRRAHGHGP